MQPLKNQLNLAVLFLRRWKK